MGVAKRGAAAPGLGDPRRHPLPEIVERVRADAEFDEVQGHGGREVSAERRACRALRLREPQQAGIPLTPALSPQAGQGGIRSTVMKDDREFHARSPSTRMILSPIST